MRRIKEMQHIMGKNTDENEDVKIPDTSSPPMKKQKAIEEIKPVESPTTPNPKNESTDDESGYEDQKTLLIKAVQAKKNYPANQAPASAEKKCEKLFTSALSFAHKKKVYN